MEASTRKKLDKIRDKHFLVVSHIALKSHAATGNPLYDEVLTPFLHANNTAFIHADKARKAMGALRDIDLDAIDCIVLVGGDSLLHEVVNGLLTRSDWILSIKIPVAVMPLDSNATSTQLYQPPATAIASLLFLSYQQQQHILKSPLQALTTLSGLRIFSHSRIECEMVNPIIPSTWFSFLKSSSSPSCPYNLAYLPFRQESKPSKSPSGSRSGSPVHAALAGFLGDIGRKSNGNSNPLRSPGVAEPQPVGPPLYYFSQICTQVLKPGNTVLPVSWKGLKVLASLKSKKQKNGGPLFTCDPVGPGVSCVDGNGVVDNETGTAGVLARTLCLYPPKGVNEDERMRVSGLVVDGVGFHETRGFSVEALDGVYLSLLRGDVVAADAKAVKTIGQTEGNSRAGKARGLSVLRTNTHRKSDEADTDLNWTAMLLVGLLAIEIMESSLASEVAGTTFEQAAKLIASEMRAATSDLAVLEQNNHLARDSFSSLELGDANANVAALSNLAADLETASSKVLLLERQVVALEEIASELDHYTKSLEERILRSK
ncbi:UNVERIFIED_CONTAM: Sphingosine kinase 1 [Siphonaria sp. JEL0065]|nr:Sphingosine kinase 1 [Siphonaria sp. JEL0065]